MLAKEVFARQFQEFTAVDPNQIVYVEENNQKQDSAINNLRDNILLYEKLLKTDKAESAHRFIEQRIIESKELIQKISKQNMEIWNSEDPNIVKSRTTYQSFREVGENFRKAQAICNECKDIARYASAADDELKYSLEKELLSFESTNLFIFESDDEDKVKQNKNVIENRIQIIQNSIENEEIFNQFANQCSDLEIDRERAIEKLQQSIQAYDESHNLFKRSESAQKFISNQRKECAQQALNMKISPLNQEDLKKNLLKAYRLCWACQKATEGVFHVEMNYPSARKSSNTLHASTALAVLKSVCASVQTVPAAIKVQALAVVTFFQDQAKKMKENLASSRLFFSNMLNGKSKSNDIELKLEK